MPHPGLMEALWHFSDMKRRPLTLTCLSECYLQLWLPLPVLTDLIWLLWKSFLHCNRYSKPQIVQIWNMNVFIPNVHVAHGSYHMTEQPWEVIGYFQMVYFLLNKIIFTINLSHCKSDMPLCMVWWITPQAKLKRQNEEGQNNLTIIVIGVVILSRGAKIGFCFKVELLLATSHYW